MPEPSAARGCVTRFGRKRCGKPVEYVITIECAHGQWLKGVCRECVAKARAGQSRCTDGHEPVTVVAARSAQGWLRERAATHA